MCITVLEIVGTGFPLRIPSDAAMFGKFIDTRGYACSHSSLSVGFSARIIVLILFKVTYTLRERGGAEA
jgi:hypothetical protein